MPLIAIGPDTLDVAALMAEVSARHAHRADAGDVPGPGAVATFVGLVRNRHQGRVVVRLEYEAYPALALKVFDRILAEAAMEWPGSVLAVHHRTGLVPIGEASVVVVAASAHRGEAFSVCRYGIERVKQIAPVWKHEYYDGGDAWVEGALADPDDARAREEAREVSCR
jgi:molybdopterin synthase catalytic subunit